MQVVLQPLLRLKISKFNELSFTAASGGSKVKRIFMLKQGHEAIRRYKSKTTNKSRIQHTTPACLFIHTPGHSEIMCYLCKLQLRPYGFLTSISYAGFAAGMCSRLYWGRGEVTWLWILPHHSPRITSRPVSVLILKSQRLSMDLSAGVFFQKLINPSNI